MSVRFSTKSRGLKQLATLTVLVGLGACGQIGPLYLPEPVDSTAEQTEGSAEQPGNVETGSDTKGSEEPDDD